MNCLLIMCFELNKINTHNIDKTINIIINDHGVSRQAKIIISDNFTNITYDNI